MMKKSDKNWPFILLLHNTKIAKKWPMLYIDIFLPIGYN